MKICKRWLCLITVLVTFHKIDAAIPFKKVALATSTKSTTTATTTTTSTTTTINATPSEEASLNSEDENRSDNATTLKNSKLTGIPQIDYIWDPNLPRELRGYNLSSYPFFASVPPEEDIHFKCDGLHDGFYASIEHKCQLYHHCVYGIRHDFLCANFTAFDQKTFICHFVSDVDCEGSQKYWNRNDDLYMATTTTSTTTTTTEPPPTTPRKKLSRPLRPLRRPINHRRPIDDDYYYDEEDYEYDDDYYEEILKRRRKQRPRHRKPLIDYEDDYEDAKRSIDIKPRRNYSRDQIRETDMQSEDDDYETEHRKVERPKIRHKPTPLSERRKINSRKSSSVQGHSNVEDRRPTNEEKPIPRHKKVSAVIPDDFNEPNEHVPRRPTNRRRITGRRFSSSSTVNDTEDVDDDKTHGHETDVGETGLTPEEEVPTKAKTKSKTLEELITPKAAPTSVYARPRTPPRIARPVPINEKKKFQYPVQKSATIPYKHEASQEDTLDYYEEDEDYDDIRRHRGSSRRRPVGETKPRDDIDDDEPPLSGTRRRKAKPARTLRKPVVVNKKTVTTTIKTTSTVNDDEDDYDTDESYVGRSGHRRRNNYTGRTNSKYDVTEDVDFVDEDYEDRPLKRPKVNSRNSQRKPSPSPETEAEFDESEEDVSEKKLQRSRTPTNAGRRTRPASGLTRMRPHTPQTVSDETNSEQTDEVDYSPSGPGKSLTATSNHRSTAVRIVKRPFLPSRGGSPYLPRGLQPVGIAIKPIDATSTTTTDRNQGAPHINMGSTISGVHLLEHGAPLLRESAPPRTTLPPRSPLPLSKSQSVLSAPEIPSKATLDELYETDYDVTLNDALNPTLKPLSPHQPLHLQQFQPQQYNYQTNQTSNSKNNNRSYSNGIYLASPQSDISFLHHRNNQSPSSSVIIDHHVHHQLLPSSSPSLPLLSHHHPSSSSVQRQLQTQSYHFHNAPKQQKLLRQEQSINNDHNDNNDNYNSDTYFSSTDIRQQAIASAPSQAESNRHIDTATNNSTIPRHPQEHHPQQQQQQQQQSFYEDYEYY